MPAYLLDINHLSAAINRLSKLRERIYHALQAGARIGTCIPALCELEVAIVHRSRANTFRRQLGHLLKRVRVWPLGDSIPANYAAIYHFLKVRGRVLSQVDIMIAALAQEMKLTVLTSDQDFTALPDLRTENWLIEPDP